MGFMPVVEITMFKGRTDEQKAELIKSVSKTIAEVLKIPVEEVYVIIREITKADWGPQGKPYGEVKK